MLRVLAAQAEPLDCLFLLDRVGMPCAVVKSSSEHTVAPGGDRV